MFERIDTVCLTVSNLEESSIWYQKLGFKVAFKGEGYQVFTIGNSGIPLTIEEGNVDSPDNSTYPIFFTNDIKTTYVNLKEKGVEVTELKDDGDNTFFDLYDLDKNKLQVCFWE
ncbi:VOC family protein [Sediminibacillus halophilus]|uniref:Glyoxalase/Bleomycin resistance protein/Dioxygenase superfamily protein n=1 Tax=Sediminibacillus halophilus TaxID=482461 RepID=A0A1G9W6T6_9BACI|nr:VOC family protein [Sediminibacillus halophilus]SDM80190.1 Glyoxalase/Bleomycin resistance protein/Dioxygenase superfamily protein [Sediminibacillus halophilus]